MIGRTCRFCDRERCTTIEFDYPGRGRIAIEVCRSHLDDLAGNDLVVA